MKKETIKKGNELITLINAMELNLETIKHFRKNLKFKLVSVICYNDIEIYNDIIGNKMLDIVETYTYDKLEKTKQKFKELL